jgi:hypothetical protein
MSAFVHLATTLLLAIWISLPAQAAIMTGEGSFDFSFCEEYAGGECIKEIEGLSAVGYWAVESPHFNDHLIGEIPYPDSWSVIDFYLEYDGLIWDESTVTDCYCDVGEISFPPTFGMMFAGFYGDLPGGGFLFKVNENVFFDRWDANGGGLIVNEFNYRFEVPAPATLALFGLGLAGLAWSRRKKG